MKKSILEATCSVFEFVMLLPWWKQKGENVLTKCQTVVQLHKTSSKDRAFNSFLVETASARQYFNFLQ